MGNDQYCIATIEIVVQGIQGLIRYSEALRCAAGDVTSDDPDAQDCLNGFGKCHEQIVKLYDNNDGHDLFNAFSFMGHDDNSANRLVQLLQQTVWFFDPFCNEDRFQEKVQTLEEIVNHFLITPHFCSSNGGDIRRIEDAQSVPKVPATQPGCAHHDKVLRYANQILKRDAATDLPMSKRPNYDNLRMLKKGNEPLYLEADNLATKMLRSQGSRIS